MTKTPITGIMDAMLGAEGSRRRCWVSDMLANTIMPSPVPIYDHQGSLDTLAIPPAAERSMSEKWDRINAAHKAIEDLDDANAALVLYAAGWRSAHLAPTGAGTVIHRVTGDPMNVGQPVQQLVADIERTEP